MCTSSNNEGVSGAIRFAQRSDPMAIVVDKRTVERKSRLVHISLLSLNLRFMENWRSALGSTGSALCYESLMILMAIIVIGAEKILRSELEPDLQSLAKQLPSSRVGMVNLSSIAAATGINRETVRRKVNNLKAAGWITRDREGIRTVQGVIPYEVLQEVIGAQLDIIARIVSQLTRIGVLSSDRSGGFRA